MPPRVATVRARFLSADSAERKEDRLERELVAKRICASCGVREECLEAALARHESYGIWGGLNEIERRGLLARDFTQPSWAGLTWVRTMRSANVTK